MDTERIQKLHDRATRGKILAPEEQVELDAWYAQQDEQEAETLSGISANMPRPDLPSLRRKVYEAQISLAYIVNENQELSAQNDALRTDIAQLKVRLATRTHLFV